VEPGGELRTEFSKLRGTWISTRFSLGVDHRVFSDHTENIGSDKHSAGFTNLIVRSFELHHPDNAFFIFRFNATPGKAIR
jgi:hypothetical protein